MNLPRSSCALLVGAAMLAGCGSSPRSQVAAAPDAAAGASTPLPEGGSADEVGNGEPAGDGADAESGAIAPADEGSFSPPGDGGGAAADCGSLPPEPVIPPACTTLSASLAVAPETLPPESSLDTTRIQSALDACPSGQAVRLVASGSNNAFVSGPLDLPDGVTLWVDVGATLYGSRNPTLYGATCGTTSGGTCSALINVTSTGAGIMGSGTIDGQGGEPIMGQTQSWWDLTGSTNGTSANPALIQTTGASRFTLYEITLHNSPKFHVKLDANSFVVWGVTIKTPSAATNSEGTALTPSGAHNTDGIDPGESASNGYIVYSNISDGDDQIAIKGGTSVHDIVVAHDHFLAGHGMSIGSETNGGVTNVTVCDLSIDGTQIASAGSANGLRIKSYPGVGGPVTNVSYSDVCVRGVQNPIVLTPFYATGTGSLPDYTGISIHDFHVVGSSPQPAVVLEGYDSAHITQVALDGVFFDTPPTVTAENAQVTIGPGASSFTPSGTDVTVTQDVVDAGTPNPCTGKWVSF